MAEDRRDFKEKGQEKLANAAERIGTFSNNMYTMFREKAASMGHAAADFPDEIWEKYMDRQDRKATLRNAKLCIESYMMGGIDAQEFARMMAGDDKLRYTISDICRERLQPTEFNVEYNGGIDIVGGIKTFWTEIRVPLPSEVDAARDIRNIYFGIEAARSADGKAPEAGKSSEGMTLGVANAGPDKPIRKRLDDIKQLAGDLAQKGAKLAVEKLTPIAEGKKDEKKEIPELTEEWLETPEGQAYKEQVTLLKAGEINGIAKNVDVVKGTEAVNDDEIRSAYSKEELNSELNPDMKELLDQIALHASRDMGNSYNKEGKHENNDNGNDKGHSKSDGRSDDYGNGNGRGRNADSKKGYISGTFEGEQVSFKDAWSGHKFTEDEAQKLLAGETVSFSYEKDGKEKTAKGKLEWQEYKGREFLGFKPDFSKKNEQAEQVTETKEPVKEEAGADDSLFNESDEALMNYEMGDEQEQVTVQDDGFAEDYYSRLAEEMDSYQSEGGMDYGDIPKNYSDEEQADIPLGEALALFENDGQQL